MISKIFSYDFGKALSAGFIVVSLVSCGVPTDQNASANTSSTIMDYSMTGNIAAAGVTQRIDLAMKWNNERASSFFNINWDAVSSDPYSVFVHISSDASTSLGADDRIFLAAECGSDSLSYVCDSMGNQECAIAYDPEYSYQLDPITGDRVLVDGNPVRLTNPDGSYIAVDHYFLRCPHGGATVAETEITPRMQTAGFPATSLNNYIVFTVCNEAGDSCDTRITALEILDVDQTD